MHSIVRLLLISLGLCLQPLAMAAELVRVGAYHFPPYVSKPESTEPGGVLPELLAQLNAVQQDYRFTLVPTSVTRRYRDFTQARYDLILFESPEWGWQDIELDKLDLHVSDAEVYVARAEPGRGQDYFDSLKGKRMALYNGYHYGFAGFNADQDYLTRTFKAVLTYSHDSNLLMLLHGRVELSVVPRSYLRLYQQSQPEQSQQLLVSERADQVYHHQALLRRDGPLRLETLARLLEGLQSSGKLPALLARYHLRPTTGEEHEQANPMQL